MLIHNRRQLFGDKTYEFLIMCHLGLGRTEIQPAEEYERKSVGTESTFRDMSDPPVSLPGSGYPVLFCL